MTPRARATLLVAASAAVLGTVGVVVAQNAPPPEAQALPPPAAPAPSAPAAPPSIDSLVAGEAPPGAEAPIAPVGAQVDAEEARLTAQAEAAAAARPTQRPRRAARRAQAEAGTATEGEDAAPGAPQLPRPRFATAVLQGLEKTTARTVRFEARVGEPIRYEGLIVTVRACERTRPEEPADAAAYLEVFAQPQNTRSEAVRARQVYRGWTFAEAPAVNPFGHPLYDLWLVECRGRSLPAARPSAPQTQAAATPAPRA